MKNKLLIAVLAALAAVMIALHLRVPHITQVWRVTESSAAVRSGQTMPYAMPQGDVDVNAASAEELTVLTGVGPALAQKIVAEREQNGDFHYPEDLINVKGIGEKMLERMREQLRLP